MEQFEKIRTLGRGAQGSVILVRRKSDKSKFVVKMVAVDIGGHEEREAVMSEIKVCVQISGNQSVAMFPCLITRSPQLFLRFV